MKGSAPGCVACHPNHTPRARIDSEANPSRQALRYGDRSSVAGDRDESTYSEGSLH